MPDRARAGAPPADRWLARDKAAHASLSCALVGFGYHWATRESGSGRPAARTGSALITLSLGTAKEARDGCSQGNRFSWKDLAADVLGTACGIILFTRR